jgi:predicted AAA+ superfamily ATPase
MKRDAIKSLYAWKEDPRRKPLILFGARQVGKTWLMKEFAREAYRKYLYVNFEEEPRVKSLFDSDFDINRILAALQLIYNVDIDEETLLLFDEVQEAPRGLMALKYFQEKAPQYAIIAAGSLLGIAMHAGDSFPVGKVDHLNLYPLTFGEYLDACGEERLRRVLDEQQWELVGLMKEQLKTLLREYYFVGGMPEAVNTYLQYKDYARVRQVQLRLLDDYEHDFSKHAPVEEVPRIRMVWSSVASQLVKENKKFIYGVIKEGARAKEFELALEWLKDAGLIYQVQRTKSGEFPLSAYVDLSAFKLFLLDVGLLGAMHRIPARLLVEGDALLTEYKGALTEQYVLQQMKALPNVSPFYWSADNSRGELDFLVQTEEHVFPVEVKAEENLRSKSLKAFVDKYPELQGLRFSMSDYREQDWLRNVPLYAVGSYMSRL